MKTTDYPWGTFAICWIAGLCAGMDANLFSVLLLPIMSSLAHTADTVVVGQLGSFALSSFLIGWTIGGIAIGVASDRFGRVPAMASAVLLFSLFSAVAACAQTTTQLAACRFLMGIGVGGAMVNMSVLLAECWPSPTRALAVGSLLTSYQAGVFASGMLVHFVPEWRLAFAAGSLPIVLAIVILYGIKEKPKQPHVEAEGQARQERRSVWMGSLMFGSLLVAYWASASWIPTWIQDLDSAVSGQEKSVATMWHGLAAIVGCFLAGPIANRFGRIPTAAAAFLMAFVVTVSMIGIFREFSLWVYVNYALLGLAIGIAQATLYIYLPEMFSHKTRGRNVGLCLNMGRVFTVVAVLFGAFLVPLLEGYANGIVLFAMSYLIGIGAALAGKETVNQELPA